MNLETLLSKATANERGCLLIGKPTSRRYWTVGFNGRTENAHKVAWVLANGPIAEGLFVLHRCDNTRCINPAHLFLGTQLENMRDRDAKGRNGTVGEKQPRHKLTASQVVAIAALSGSSKEIARQFGIAPVTVQRIRSKTTRKKDLTEQKQAA